MKQIGEGIYVQDFDEYRSYLIEAEYAEHIKSFTSKESAEQEIKLREGSDAQAETITNYINEHDFHAESGKDNVIFVETEDPTKLVKELCEGGYIDIEQATAIMAFEIEHIRNPDMQRKISGGKRLKEIREVVIQYNMHQQKNGSAANKVGSAYNKDQGKLK
jgi:hypothetical protein